MNNPGYYLSEAEDIHHRFIPILHGYPSEQKEHSLETQKVSKPDLSIPVGSNMLGSLVMDVNMIQTQRLLNKHACLQHMFKRSTL